MEAIITPKKLSGKIKAPQSKSAAHRAIIAAALCKEKTEIELSDLSQDIKATLGCISALSGDYEYKNGIITIIPIENPHGKVMLNAGESGTTARILQPVARALFGDVEIIGQGRLEKRIAGLPQGALHAGLHEVSGAVSSQYISGLLFALPLLDGDSEIKVTDKISSAPYIEMTIDTLARFGITIEKEENSFFIKGGQDYRSPKNLKIEGDFSSAAFFLCAGAMGGEITVDGLDINSKQGDKKILEIVASAGAEVETRGGGVKVLPRYLRGFSVDAGDIPDLVPVLGSLAAAAEGESKIYNVDRLRFKESDRLSAVIKNICALGGKAVYNEDVLKISGGGLRGGAADGFSDHRMVMSAAVASVACLQKVYISTADAVKKSYNRFFEDFRMLGGTVDGIELWEKC